MPSIHVGSINIIVTMTLHHLSCTVFNVPTEYMLFLLPVLPIISSVDELVTCLV